MFTQCLKPLFRKFLMVVLLFREKAKKACLAKPLQDRERERGKRRFCEGKVDGTALRVILFRLTENSILMNEISENTLNVELNKLFLVKIHFRESYTRLSPTWRSQIWSEEIRNTHYLSHSVGLNLKDYSYWRPINVHHAQQERILLCSELKMKNRLHQEGYARSCPTFEELKRSCYPEEIMKNNKDWKNFLCSMIRDHVR